jgi:preprotein translocase subunit SecA
MRDTVIDALVSRTMPEKAYAEQWDIEGLAESLRGDLGVDLPVKEWAAEEGVANEEIALRIREVVEAHYANLTKQVGDQQMRRIEKQLLLQVLDLRWREHLQQIDQLRSVIHLRSYGQRDPLNEFKREAFNLFDTLLSELRATVTRSLMLIRVQTSPVPEAPRRPAPVPPAQPPVTHETKLDPDTGVNEMNPAEAPVELPQAEDDWSDTPRNSACPCGSGKKYKHCHGAIETQKV